MTDAAKFWLEVIPKVGIFLLMEAAGFVYLAKAYFEFNVMVAGTGLILVLGGALFEVAIWWRRMESHDKPKATEPKPPGLLQV